MKIFICINTLTSVEQLIYANHMVFFHKLGKRHPNDIFALHTPRRHSIDRARNASAKMALEGDFDYLMFIDDDVIIPDDILEKLLAAEKDIVAGWTIIRGWPFDNMFFKFQGTEEQIQRKQRLEPLNGVERNSGILNVDAIGFSTALIKCDLLKKIPPPWFVTGPTNTEDIYFCLKARQYVPECTIAVETSVETAHALGPEFIAPWNREDYKKYQLAQHPEIGDKVMASYLDKSGDRGSKYLQMVQGPLPSREVAK